MAHWRHGLLAAILLLPSIARARITPRDVVTIDRNSVTLGDLFSGLGARAGKVIGKAPAPGARIEVQSRQLAAIARQFSVRWRPSAAGNGAEVVILREESPIPRDPVKAALRAPLAAAGAPAQAAISIPPSGLPMIPPHATPLNVSYDATSGRFTATMLISARAMRSTRAHVAGYAQPSRIAVVATHALAPGEVITHKDVELRRILVHALPKNPSGRIAGVIGLEAERAVAAGAPPEREAPHPSSTRRARRNGTARSDNAGPRGFGTRRRPPRWRRRRRGAGSEPRLASRCPGNRRRS